jgi:hypothetical protein
MRKGADIPKRVDMTPGPMMDGLAHCFVLERVTPSVARFRVAGQSVQKLLNMEPRGMPISALFTPAGREMLAPIIYDVCEQPEINEIPLIATRGLARSPLRARMLLLPLRNDDEGINRLFGALVVDGKPSRRALRFDFDPNANLRTQPVRPVIRTVHEILADTRDQIAVPTPVRRTPHQPLRLVIDNT